MRKIVLVVLLIMCMMMEAKIRKPAVAGQFYAGDAQELRHDLKEHFLKCKASPLEHVQAIIVPHAGCIP